MSRLLDALGKVELVPCPDTRVALTAILKLLYFGDMPLLREE